METLLTEAQCARAARVSVETIRQYKKFGLLSSVGQDSNELYRAGEVAQLFFISSEAIAPFLSSSTKEHSEAVTPAEHFTEQENPAAIEIEPSPQGFIPKDASPAASPEKSDRYLELNQFLLEEIRNLREEREWLRERIEKLEARFEREQMLLLSSSETIRGFMNQQQMLNKRPRWSFQLPWLKE